MNSSLTGFPLVAISPFTLPKSARRLMQTTIEYIAGRGGQSLITPMPRLCLTQHVMQEVGTTLQRSLGSSDPCDLHAPPEPILLKCPDT